MPNSGAKIIYPHCGSCILGVAPNSGLALSDAVYHNAKRSHCPFFSSVFASCPVVWSSGRSAHCGVPSGANKLIPACCKHSVPPYCVTVCYTTFRLKSGLLLAVSVTFWFPPVLSEGLYGSNTAVRCGNWGLGECINYFMYG
jgi:hypothetical protein